MKLTASCAWVVACCCSASMVAHTASARTLDIYFTDMEGGAATLIVTPAGESVLVDTGSPGGRDADRIARVAKDVAGLKQIDHCIITHWHLDHVGGVPDLVKRIPVKRFYDRGIPEPLPRDIRPPDVEGYKQVTKGNTTVLKAGDEMKLQQAKGAPPLQLRVVAAGGLLVGEQPGAPQVRACDADHAAAPEDDSDNAKSIATLLSFGEFQFFNGADLTLNIEHRLACPKNLVGPVDVYQVDHHGLDLSNHPALVRALAPRVAVMLNGTRKGCGPKTVAALKAAQVEVVFQMHRNLAPNAANTAPELIANDTADCKAGFIQVSVEATGKRYTVSVPGKGTTRTFEAR